MAGSLLRSCYDHTAAREIDRYAVAGAIERKLGTRIHFDARTIGKLKDCAGIAAGADGLVSFDAFARSDGANILAGDAEQAAVDSLRHGMNIDRPDEVTNRI